MIKKKKLNLLMLTALVTGNMIGSGIFLLPANLARIGSVSILSWCATTVGAFFLAFVFAKMSILVPKTGGPYAYAKAGFGKFIGFQTAYNYWIALWVGNAAIAIATIGYMAVFFPILTYHPMIACLFAIAIVWLLTYINIIGVRSAGIMQLVTTILKILPIGLVIIFGWWYFHPGYLTQNFNVSHQSNLHAFSSAAALTLWAFIGMESATIPAAATQNPERNIPLATLFGTLIAAIVYVASCTALMGMIPMQELANTTYPFATAAKIIFGHWGKWIIGAGAAISCFGALNGWTLLQGQVPMAAADDGLFPRVFAKRNKAGVPALGMIITACLITLLLLFTISPNLINQFETIVLIAIFASVIPYLYTTIAQLIVLRRHHRNTNKIHFFVALVTCVYVFWIIFSAPRSTIYYGSIIIFMSIPLYALKFPKK